MRIVVTGGAGFIGSCFIWLLNRQGFDDIIVVDHLGEQEKWKNLVGKRFEDYLEKGVFLAALQRGHFDDGLGAIVHMGACSSTTENDASYLIENNYRYSKILARWAFENQCRIVYASSAATYGGGEQGYSDDDRTTLALRPLNMYGYSKHAFDLWLLKNGAQERCAGLKFFNVFGPNEYHKGDMRSMVHKGYQQIRRDGRIALFCSHRPDYADGEQKRDFIYVKDAVNAIYYCMVNTEVNGIFNVGSGKAHSWNELALALFDAMGVSPRIEYIDMPQRLRGKYQYFTEAKMEKLRRTGFDAPPMPLASAIKDYVTILKGEGYL
jgi:ADP-L-glycero-D-manno-heptose 6-epimerase